MHRGNRCLNEEEIGAFLEGKLESRERELLLLHLEACEACLDDIALIGKALTFSDGIPFSTVPERLVASAVSRYPAKSTFFDAVLSLAAKAIRVVDCLPFTDVSIPQPAFSLRSAESVGPQVVVLKKSFDDIDAEFIIERLSDVLCNIKVIAADKATGEQLSHHRAGLFSGGRQLASYLLEDGAAVFEEIGPGRYTIRIERRGGIYGAITLKIE
ncbi:MAG: hypothetical protein OEW04_09375 [Nitrospirota bacterium]|nr:hypothetical protein [Nitrospirota bacterium]